MIDAKTKQKLLNGLHKFGNIYMACLSVGISRADYYRWKEKDEKFREKAEEAVRMGRENFVDISEGSLMKNVKNGNQKAIEFALKHNSQRYKTESSQKSGRWDEPLPPVKITILPDPKNILNDNLHD